MTFRSFFQAALKYQAALWWCAYSVSTICPAQSLSVDPDPLYPGSYARLSYSDHLLPNDTATVSAKGLSDDQSDTIDIAIDAHGNGSADWLVPEWGEVTFNDGFSPELFRFIVTDSIPVFTPSRDSQGISDGVAKLAAHEEVSDELKELVTKLYHRLVAIEKDVTTISLWQERIRVLELRQETLSTRANKTDSDLRQSEDRLLRSEDRVGKGIARNHSSINTLQASLNSLQIWLIGILASTVAALVGTLFVTLRRLDSTKGRGESNTQGEALPKSATQDS